MQFLTLVLLAGGATAVTADMQLRAPKRVVAVQPRQTDDSTACDSAAEDIESTMPTPASDLYDFFYTSTGTGSCLSIPTSLTSEWNDYTSSEDAWYSASSDELSSFLDQCTDYDFGLISEYCTEDAGSSHATTTADDAGVTSATAKTTAKTTDKSDETTKTEATKTEATGKTTATAGAAPLREAGIVGAVLAGALGVAVAL